MMTYEKQFAKCVTIEAVNDLSKEMQRDRSDAAKQRRKEIHEIMYAPFHDEAKRWRQGDKVYFGKPDIASNMSFENQIRIWNIYDIKAGQWCRVWKYQSRKKMAWLCQPGKPCKWENLIRQAFRLRTLHDADVSRTEILLRPTRNREVGHGNETRQI